MSSCSTHYYRTTVRLRLSQKSSVGEIMGFELRIFAVFVFIAQLSGVATSWTFPVVTMHRIKAQQNVVVVVGGEDDPILLSPPTSTDDIITTRKDQYTFNSKASIGRRTLLAVPIVMAVSIPRPTTAMVQQAVGSGESNCRANNNCLELGELDGAIGWGWGGKDRCDPNNPRCGADGKLRETDIVGQPVPKVPTIVSSSGEEAPVRFTHIAAIQIEIGRGEVGVLKIGLYGNEFPDHVRQLVNFWKESGFQVDPESSTFGRQQPPVTLQRGGIVTSIVPSKLIELGVPVQSAAYARSLGRSKVDETFVPQPRPKDGVPSQNPLRPHDGAGLISLPKKGLGYGGTGFESDDECYESAFIITANPVPTLDKDRVVVGQILDADSMAFVERLANIPTKRGIRGVIPGQTSGPPLPKVVVREVQVAPLSTA